MNSISDGKEQFDMVYEERLDSQEQSTSTQSKQSNATMSMLNENTKNLKLKRAQSNDNMQIVESLLHFEPSVPKRKGSNSCSEPIKQNMGRKSIVYKVYWYDQNIDVKYEIALQANEDINIEDFLNDVTTEFINQNEHLQLQFEECTFELYLPKKKRGQPNEDFPAFAPKTLLGNTNLLEFALKLKPNPKEEEVIMIVPQLKKKQQPNIPKPCFWKKFLLCCFNEENEFS